MLMHSFNVQKNSLELNKESNEIKLEPIEEIKSQKKIEIKDEESSQEFKFNCLLANDEDY